MSAGQGRFKFQVLEPGAFGEALQAAAFSASKQDQGHDLVHIVVSDSTVRLFGSTPLSMGCATIDASMVDVFTPGTTSVTIAVANSLARTANTVDKGHEPPPLLVIANPGVIEMEVDAGAPLASGIRQYLDSRPAHFEETPVVDVPKVLREISRTMSPDLGHAPRYSSKQSQMIARIHKVYAGLDITHHAISEDEGRTMINIGASFCGTISRRDEEAVASQGGSGRQSAPKDVSDLPEADSVDLRTASGYLGSKSIGVQSTGPDELGEDSFDDDDEDTASPDEDDEPEQSGWTPRIVNADPPGGMA